MNKITESINDKYLFKCIFLAGGAGSGKSFVAESLSSTYSISPDLINLSNRLEFGDIDAKKPSSSAEAKELVKSKHKYGNPVKSISNENVAIVNSDDVFEYLLTKNGVTKKLTFDTENPLYDVQQGLRRHAKKLTGSKQLNVLRGMLPIIIDGTGKDVVETLQMIDDLEDLGYDVTMVFVDVELETSLARNRSRERSLEDSMIKEIWTKCRANIDMYRKALQEDFILVDNERDIIYDPNYIPRNADELEMINGCYPIYPDKSNLVESYKKNLRKLGRRIFTSRLRNPIGKDTIYKLRVEGKHYLDI